ncbi:hypothetical protein IFM89_024696 [Coptis chinensis]|uniref:Uncharacterized protein n=1 Tax=Coptis chinensis TaxID=261450 RepID=A0A835IFG1_9MAGN|nr:hypothetical protein IFM89_024696 [Coptis chinensis]
MAFPKSIDLTLYKTTKGHSHKNARLHGHAKESMAKKKHQPVHGRTATKKKQRKVHGKESTGKSMAAKNTSQRSKEHKDSQRHKERQKKAVTIAKEFAKKYRQGSLEEFIRKRMHKIHKELLVQHEEEENDKLDLNKVVSISCTPDTRENMEATKKGVLKLSTLPFGFKGRRNQLTYTNEANLEASSSRTVSRAAIAEGKKWDWNLSRTKNGTGSMVNLDGEHQTEENLGGFYGSRAVIVEEAGNELTLENQRKEVEHEEFSKATVSWADRVEKEGPEAEMHNEIIVEPDGTSRIALPCAEVIPGPQVGVMQEANFIAARLETSHGLKTSLPPKGRHYHIPRPLNVPFRFSKVWLSHDTFQSLVAESWREVLLGTPILKFTQKLKRLKGAIKGWNVNVFGNLDNIIRKLQAEFDALQTRGRKWQIGTVPGLTLRTWKAKCFGFHFEVSVWHTATAVAFVPSAPTNGTLYASVDFVLWQ